RRWPTTRHSPSAAGSRSSWARPSSRAPRCPRARPARATCCGSGSKACAAATARPRARPATGWGPEAAPPPPGPRAGCAPISTHATLGARSAFRETAKALGVSHARVNALAKRVPRELEAPYLDRLAGAPEARGVDWREPPLPEALRLAERLDGALRHLSIHC